MKRPLSLRAFALACILALAPFATAPGTAFAAEKGAPEKRAKARATAPAPTLSKKDRADAERIQAYLNSIQTMKAKFLQVSSTGETAEGNILLSRPGRLRLEYEPPVPIVILVTGSVVLYYDKELQQSQYIATDRTPAEILVKDKIDLFDGDVQVMGLERGGDVLRLTVVKKSDPGGGSMTLVFSDNPLALRKWSVTDSQGIVTNVALMSPRFGAEVDPKAFIMETPTPSGTTN